MARVRSPFGFAVLGLLVLAGWAAWSAGLFDGAIASQVRSNSVYVAPGVRVDVAAAERIIGNRKLVAVFLDKDGDLSAACKETKDAADNTLVMLFKPGDGEWDHYGCSNFGDIDNNPDDFGHAMVAENTAPDGADQFLDRPLEAVKVVAVNYDSLVKAGIVPDGPRTIQPSGARYLLAVVAVLAVVGGAVTVYVVGRRVGRLAARHQRADETLSDERASLNAKVGVLAQRIIELDRGTSTREHRRLAADYADLARDLAADTGADAVDPALVARVDLLMEHAGDLGRTAPARRSRGKRSADVRR